MSEITKPIMLDETGRLIVEGIARQNLLLTQMITTQGTATPVATLNEIHEIVRAGEAANVFSIGDQIMLNYNDGTNDYVLPWDIVHFGNVELQDGEIVPGMWLQWHYCTPFGVQFDNYEAFYVATEGLSAGTYHVTLAQTWSQAVAGSYQFTLTQDVPEGGYLMGFTTMADRAPSAWTVSSYASQTATSAIETVAVESGDGGTDLGTMPYNKAGTLNSMYRTGYGYHRWSQSGIRQWLNSKAAVGAWWTPQNAFDRAPSELSSQRGFMAGFDDDFLAILGKVKVTTALNTYEDFATDREDTYDTFFLPSLEQMYGTPQLAGAEGEYWEYWKRALGLTSPAGTESSNVYEAYKTYAINAKTSAQAVRLRSAYRGGYYTWSVTSAGSLYYGGYPYFSNRCAPACVIC